MATLIVILLKNNNQRSIVLAYNSVFYFQTNILTFSIITSMIKYV